MSKGPTSFKATDASRLIRAVEKAGVRVARIEFEDRKITIIPGNADGPAENDPNEWDAVR